MNARRRRRASPRPRMRTSRNPSAGSSYATRRRDCSSRRSARGSDGTDALSLRRVPDHRVIAVAEEGLVQKLHVLADRPGWHVFAQALLGRLEGAELDVRETLDLQIKLEKIGRDRPQVLRVRPERVRADRERLRVRRDEDDRCARGKRAAARAKYFDELAGKDVLGEMPRVQPVDAPGLDLP